MSLGTRGRFATQQRNLREETWTGRVEAAFANQQTWSGADEFRIRGKVAFATKKTCPVLKRLESAASRLCN